MSPYARGLGGEPGVVHMVNVRDGKQGNGVISGGNRGLGALAGKKLLVSCQLAGGVNGISLSP